MNPEPFVVFLLATAKHTNKVAAQVGKSDSKITSSFFLHPSYIKRSDYVRNLLIHPNEMPRLWRQSNQTK
jgi:hypothetical protein